MAVRRSDALFPAAAQLAIAAVTVIANSRLTFTGQRGLVLVVWRATFVNAGAVAVPQLDLGAVGTVSPLFAMAGHGWFDAAAGRVMTLTQFGFFLDPAEGSFVEANITPSAGSVDLTVNNGAVIALSFEAGTGEGPTVTIT